MADEELLRDKVYNRVNELRKENPELTNQQAMEQVRQELGFDKLTTVSANYYRGRAADPDAPASNRGRPKGSRNKTDAASEAPAAAQATQAASAAPATKATRARRSTTAKKAAAKPARKATTTRRRSTTAAPARSRAKASAGAASTADLSKAVETLNGLVDENQRLSAEVRELREQLARISEIASL